ncbi:MAG: metal ABC transporter permease [Candidatus Micrarchaeota archaeon]
MLELFSYKFMQNAFFAGTLVAILCASVGLFVVLRKLSFLTDGIAHISLAGLAIAIVTKANLLAVTLAVALLSALGMNRLREKLGLSGDAAIGIMFPVGLSIGIVILTLAKVTSIDLVSYLFGSILAIGETDMLLIVVFGIIILSVLFYLRKGLLYIAFDEDSARASGLSVSLLNYAFFALAGATVVLAVRVAGVLLVSALMLIPPSAALQLKRGFKQTIIFSCVFGVLSVWLGIFLSYYSAIPAGATIALSSFLFFLAAYVVKPKKPAQAVKA